MLAKNDAANHGAILSLLKSAKVGYSQILKATAEEQAAAGDFIAALPTLDEALVHDPVCTAPVNNTVVRETIGERQVHSQSSD